MTDIDVHLVREFFELHLFRVTTNWPQGQFRPDGSAQLFVESAREAPNGHLDTLLRPDDIPYLTRALVEIRAWHSDRVYASLIDSKAVFTQFAAPQSLARAREFFGGESFAKVLVISEFAPSRQARQDALDRFRNSPVDYVIEFPSILHSLAGRVSVGGAYPGSASLQVIQLLKRYGLLRYQQMEMDFPLVHPVEETRSP